MLTVTYETSSHIEAIHVQVLKDWGYYLSLQNVYTLKQKTKRKVKNNNKITKQTRGMKINKNLIMVVVLLFFLRPLAQSC